MLNSPQASLMRARCLINLPLRRGNMAHRRTSDLPRPFEYDPDGLAEEALRTPLRTKIECLQQILWAFRDIADRDDIHQAADRLALVQDWIHNEANRAAADPIFLDLRLV
jgi:hypothetical protein